MGQAKNRGTQEQRIANAIDRRTRVLHAIHALPEEHNSRKPFLKLLGKHGIDKTIDGLRVFKDNQDFPETVREALK